MTSKLDKYQAAWKKNKTAATADQLTEKKIMDFIKHESIGVTVLFRKGLLTDLFLKFALAISFLILVFMYQAQPPIQYVNLVIIVITTVLMVIQFRYYRQISLLDDPADSVREALNRKIDFYNQKFVNALYISGATNPLLFLSGMMYYFYFKYGGVRPLDLEDYLVFSGAMILGFALGAFIQIRQYRFHVHQLETCLQELDDDAITELTMKKIRNQRIRQFSMALIFIIFGLLVLSYFWVK